MPVPRPVVGSVTALTVFAAAAAAAAAGACNGSPTMVTAPIPSPGVRTALPPLASGTVAFVGVNVVPMTGPEALSDRTVIVRDGRIDAIGPREETEIPADAERIDADGRFLLPGLIDMHVHLSRADIDAYLAAGITTVRNMWGTPTVAQLRAEAAEGALVPTIFSAGPGLDGDPPYWPNSVVVEEADAAAEAVERQAADGWDFIKVYNSLEPGPYDAIIERARELGVTVVGHTPRPVGLERALEAGQASIEHMGGFEVALGGRVGFAGWQAMDAGRLDSLARRVAERGVWICPTLSVVAELTRRLGPDERATVLENRRRTLRALHEAGVPVLAGTDAGIDVVPPGARHSPRSSSASRLPGSGPTARWVPRP
ncbi:MAG: amidohydrolase family protein [Gemmatimonadota bacterium]